MQRAMGGRDGGEYTVDGSRVSTEAAAAAAAEDDDDDSLGDGLGAMFLGECCSDEGGDRRAAM